MNQRKQGRKQVAVSAPSTQVFSQFVVDVMYVAPRRVDLVRSAPDLERDGPRTLSI